jgi:hypothetical protein
MWGELRWLHGPFQVLCVLVAVLPTASLSLRFDALVSGVDHRGVRRSARRAG